MNISDLEFFLTQIPGTGGHSPVRSLLVRLETDSGAEGWGEAAPNWQSTELAARRQALLPLLAGRNLFETEDLLRLDPLRDPNLACAIEMAVWDAIGQSLDQPLCYLTGGDIRRRIPIAARLPLGDAAQVVRVSRELSEQGFHTQILTASGDVAADVSLARSVSEAATDRTSLRFDAACRYDAEAARDVCRQLENLDLEAILDPIASADFDQLASLRRQTSIPLTLFEGIYTPADILKAFRGGAASAVVVDPGQVGGLTPTRKCAMVAEAADLTVSLRSQLGAGVAAAASLQLAAATASLDSANECAYHEQQEDLLVDSLEVLEGMITLPDGPGLGIQVDRSKLEHYQVG